MNVNLQMAVLRLTFSSLCFFNNMAFFHCGTAPLVGSTLGTLAAGRAILLLLGDNGLLGDDGLSWGPGPLVGLGRVVGGGDDGSRFE